MTPRESGVPKASANSVPETLVIVPVPITSLQKSTDKNRSDDEDESGGDEYDQEGPDLRRLPPRTPAKKKIRLKADDKLDELISVAKDVLTAVRDMLVMRTRSLPPNPAMS